MVKKLIVVFILSVIGCSQEAPKQPTLSESQLEAIAKSVAAEKAAEQRKRKAKADARKKAIEEHEARKKRKAEEEKRYAEKVEANRKLWEANPKSTKYTIVDGFKVPIPVEETEASEPIDQESLIKKRKENLSSNEYFYKARRPKSKPLQPSLPKTPFEIEKDELDDWYLEEMAGALDRIDEDAIDSVYESELRKLYHRYGKKYPF